MHTQVPLVLHALILVFKGLPELVPYSHQLPDWILDPGVFENLLLLLSLDTNAGHPLVSIRGLVLLSEEEKTRS